MSKSLWMAGLALVFLCAGPAMAGDPAKATDAGGGASAQVTGEGSISAHSGANGETIVIRSGGMKSGETAMGKPGEYWLGVVCFPVMPALRAQLNLPEKQGLLVMVVVPESPAAKAGIQQHDILMSVGNKPLAEVQNLLEAIESAKGVKIKIELIRGGKPKSLEAAPAKQPREARRNFLPPPESGDLEMVQQWMQGMYGQARGQDDRPPMKFWISRPGAIVPGDVLMPRPLPPNTSVSIGKQGDKPTKITVTRGDEKWEVTEKELDKLPADLRPVVERMLGHATYKLKYEAAPDVMWMQGGPGQVVGTFQRPVPPPGMMQIQSLPPQGPWAEGLQKQLDETNRRLEKLSRAMDRLADELREARHGRHPAQEPVREPVEEK